MFKKILVFIMCMFFMVAGCSFFTETTTTEPAKSEVTKPLLTLAPGTICTAKQGAYAFWIDGGDTLGGLVRYTVSSNVRIVQKLTDFGLFNSETKRLIQISKGDITTLKRIVDEDWTNSYVVYDMVGKAHLLIRAKDLVCKE
jgi:hypothetical protein